MKKIIVLVIFAIISLPLYCQSDAELELLKLKILHPEKYSEINKISSKIKNTTELKAFNFVIANSPLSDLADYSPNFIYSNIKIALLSKKEMSWGKKIPETIFNHFVLPPRVNNENLDSFRILMYEELKSRVKNMSMYDAALEVNHWCHEKVTYQGSDGRTSAPLSTIRYSFGRCGEESTLLVAALRTVGLASRQVYTPRWAHTDNNHAWVEVWVDGKWYFLGACEPSPELDMGWFAVPSTRTMYVHTRVFGKYSGDEQVVSNYDKFAEINLISNYTKTKNLKVNVIDDKSKPVNNAKVEFQLYNYAEFFTLAKLNTNKKGMVNFQTGFGDLIIWASKDNKYGFIKADKNDSNITVRISKSPDLKSMEFTFSPPIEGKPHIPESKNVERNNQRLNYEDSVRNEYMKSFLDSSESIEKLLRYDIKDYNKYVDYLVRSYGNWTEILQYIINAEKLYAGNKSISALLDVISDKDLRDTKSDILLNHLSNALKYIDKMDYDIWKNYVLNGRIYIENMLGWRSIGDKFLTNDLGADKINQFNQNSTSKKVNTILQFITKEIKIDNIGNMHSRAPITPEGVYNLRISDNISRDIFFVALCRALGIPARIDTKTGISQYYNIDSDKKNQNNQWNDIRFEKIESKLDYGFVTFNNISSFEPNYYSNFTIRRFENGGFHTIEFDDIIPLSKLPRKMEVPAGKYMIVTGNREQNGDVLVNISYFDVDKSKETIVDVKVRDLLNEKKSWTKIDLNNLSILDIRNNKREKLANFINNEYYILAIVEPDKEPTKHFIADLPTLQTKDQTKNSPVILLVNDNSSTQKNLNKDLYQNITNSVFAVDYENNVMQLFEKLKDEKLSINLPIVIMGNKDGELFYFNKGYKIGIIDEILQLIK